MSRILAYTTPAKGHLFPILPILEELRERGHDVAVRSLRSEVGWLKERGLDAGAIDPAIEAVTMDDYVGKNPRDSLQRSIAVFARRAPLDAADLQRAIDEVRPDVLLTDVNAWGANAVAESSGLPWTVFCPYPLPLPSKDVPPFGPGLPPARGPLGRARDAVLRPLVFGMLEKTLLPPVNQVRQSIGVAPVATSAALYQRADALLYLTAEPFEYPRTDWPANVRMVGPVSFDPPMGTPAWLDDLDRPIVLVTTSSEFQDDGALVRTALDALGDEDVFVVATVPSGSVSDFSPPPNARVESFVPHGPILDRAACAVTHGGMGATQKALARGVPVCVVPFGRDQFEVARRVEVAGAGTRLLPKHLDADRLRAAVRQATRRRDGARRLAEAFQRAGGASAAADHVERAVAGRSRT